MERTTATSATTMEVGPKDGTTDGDDDDGDADDGVGETKATEKANGTGRAWTTTCNDDA